MARKNGREKGNRQVGYAVIGLGHIAQAAVLPAFAHAHNAKLVALVSGDAQKRATLARKYRWSSKGRSASRGSSAAPSRTRSGPETSAPRPSAAAAPSETWDRTAST